MAIKVGTRVAVKDDPFQVAHVVIGQGKTPIMAKTPWGTEMARTTAKGKAVYRNEWHVQNLTDGSLATYHINEIEEWN